MAIVVVKPMATTAKFNTNKRRAVEKKRIQTLKMWHENVKKIAKSEIDFIKSILQDDKDSEDRNWVRDDEIEKEPERDWEMVEKDA